MITVKPQVSTRTEGNVFDRGANAQWTVPDSRLGVRTESRAADQDTLVHDIAAALARDAGPTKSVPKCGLGYSRPGARQRGDDYQRRCGDTENRFYRDTTKYQTWKVSPKHIYEDAAARRYGVPLKDFARWRQSWKDFPQPLELNVPGTHEMIRLWHVLHLTAWERRHAARKGAEVQKQVDDRRSIKLPNEKSGPDIPRRDFPPTVGPSSALELWASKAGAEFQLPVAA